MERVTVPLDMIVEGRLPLVCALTGSRDGVTYEAMDRMVMVGRGGARGAGLYALERATNIALPGSPHEESIAARIPLSNAGRAILRRNGRLRWACVGGCVLLVGGSVAVASWTLDAAWTLATLFAGLSLLFPARRLARSVVHLRSVQDGRLTLDVPDPTAAEAYRSAAAESGPPPAAPPGEEAAPFPGFAGLAASPATWLLILSIVAINLPLWNHWSRNPSLLAQFVAMALAIAALACPPERKWVVLKAVAAGLAGAGAVSLVKTGLLLVIVEAISRIWRR